MDAVENANKEKVCHNCGKEIEFEGEEIKNGVLVVYKDREKKISIFKCQDCFQKNPELSNYQNCEVYSRVVGYLRPVQQWHVGKKQEFKERKEYKLPKKVEVNKVKEHDQENKKNNNQSV